MVKPDLIAQKLANARRRIQAAEEIFGQPLEELLPDEPARDLGCFYLFLAIQECIDIAAHWVADEDWGAPEDVGGVFDVLRDQGVIDADLAQGMRGATGLRNRIAHGYGSLDPARVWAEYRPGSKHLRAYLAAIADALDL